MKNKYYKPYNLDIKYEFKTYKNVGRDYGDSKTANLGLVGNICRFIRKKKNKNERKYAVCNTYSEWKIHVKGILPKESNCAYDDFMHWLNMKRYASTELLESIKIIVIPIYIALFNMCELFMNGNSVDNSVEKFCFMIIIVIISVIILSNQMDEVSFYEDFIKIAEEK